MIFSCEIFYVTIVLCLNILRRYDTRYDTRCYFNVRSKADISQLNLSHGKQSMKVLLGKHELAYVNMTSEKCVAQNI